MQVETPNPIATAWIVNLSTPKYLFPFELKPTNSVEPGSYITSAKFHGENSVSIIWLNRDHNTFVLVSCSNRDNYNCTDVSQLHYFTSFEFKIIFLVVSCGKGARTYWLD